jgi:uncharacterized protein YcbX
MPLETYNIKYLQIIPFKSGDAIPVPSLRMTPAGVETLDGQIKDHEYFAVRRDPDKEGIHHFVTQRTHQNPNTGKRESFRKLALIKPEVAADGSLVLTWNHTNHTKPAENYDPSKVLPIRIWDYTGLAVEDPLLSEWSSDCSGYDIRVMRTVGPWDRMANQNYLANNNPLRGQDGYPVHPILLEDVSDVSKQTERDIPWNRFRPQVVLTGQPAWSLHNIARGEAGGVEIWLPKPCDRCEMPKIDQETGEPSEIKPLALIDKVRPRWINQRGEEKILMGENWLPQGTAVLETGQSQFRALAYREEPLQFAEH